MLYQTRYILWIVCLLFAFISVCNASDSKLKPQVVMKEKKVTNLEISKKAMKATAIRVQEGKKTFAKPQGWPATMAWRPLRHFGPFTDIGDLSQIQLHINGNFVRWYFNKYYATCPDAQWHRQYFRDNLPENATPDPPSPYYIPGAFPTADGLHDLLFELDRVELKSQFGGSVELTFRAKEDYEFELRKDNTIWDFESLSMAVYVTPDAKIFNTPNQIGAKIPIGIVFQVNNPTAYTINANGQILRKPEDHTMEGLQAALDEIQAALLSPMGTDPIRYVHGFIHGQMQNKIGYTEKVKMVEISDSFLEVLTEPGTQMFSIGLRLNPITLDTSDSLKNVTGTISGIHGYTPSPTYEDNPWVSREFAFGSGDSSPFASHGHFELSTCETLKEFYIWVEVTGWYTGFISGFFKDPRKDIMLDSVSFSCETLRQRANSGQWGMVHGPTFHPDILEDSDGEFGSITVESRVHVFLR